MVFDHKIYEKDKKQAENINDNTEQKTTNHILNSIQPMLTQLRLNVLQHYYLNSVDGTTSGWYAAFWL